MSRSILLIIDLTYIFFFYYNNFMSFGERLQIARVAQCKSQKEVLEACRIPQSTLSHIEKERRKLTNDISKKLSEYLNIDMMWLETGHGSPFFRPPIGGKIIELNLCKELKSEEAALQILSEEYKLPVIFLENNNCLLFENYQYNHALYIVLYLSKPYRDLTHIFNKIKAKLLGKQVEYVDLGNIQALNDLFKIKDKDRFALLHKAVEEQDLDHLLLQIRLLLYSDTIFREELIEFLLNYESQPRNLR